VKTHLAHIFTKPVVSNRTQLAALTTRTGTEGTSGISVVPK
jgi:DNA-binding CsgD family transcriptional regulator